MQTPTVIITALMKLSTDLVPSMRRSIEISTPRMARIIADYALANERRPVTSPIRLWIYTTRVNYRRVARIKYGYPAARDRASFPSNATEHIYIHISNKMTRMRPRDNYYRQSLTNTQYSRDTLFVMFDARSRVTQIRGNSRKHCRLADALYISHLRIFSDTCR